MNDDVIVNDDLTPRTELMMQLKARARLGEESVADADSGIVLDGAFWIVTARR